MPAFTLTDGARAMRVDLPASELDLQYVSASATEGINELFALEITAMALQQDLREESHVYDQVIGEGVTLEFDLPTDRRGHHEPRCFNGIVTEMRYEGPGPGGHTYAMTAVPWFALTDRRARQRIFHRKTVQDILRDVFADHAGALGASHRFDVRRTLPVLEYVVQYGESDMAFARRMMERFGLSFRFEHSDASHEMVIFDELEVATGGRRYEVFEPQTDHGAMAEGFTSWSPTRRHVSGSVRLIDYDFKEPAKALEFDRAAPGVTGLGTEVSAYPGGYRDDAEGRRMAKQALDAQSAGRARTVARGRAPSLAPGMAFEISEAPDPTLVGQAFSCVAARHVFPTADYGTGGAGGQAYQGLYTLIPAGQPCTPERRSPRPTMRGPQTATVVADGAGGGSDIDCDDHGRVLVRFHWDLDDAKSMRCRVSQSWAGNGWGGMVIPRIGMEVIVEHIDGDPDHPIVTGCVYNGRNKPPYALPEHRTRSTFLTNTDGGRPGNELRFEDKKGAQEIFVHAERDMNTRVRKDRTERVQEDKIESVGGSKGSEIDDIGFEVVGGSKITWVGPRYRNTITPSDADEGREGIGETAHLNESARGQFTDGDYVVDVTNDHVTHAENDLLRKADRHVEETAGRNISTSSETGDISVKAELGQITLEAAQKITLKCGGSKIELTPTGIKIEGLMVAAKADVKASLAGTMVDVKGSAMTKVTGGVLKLN